MNQLLYFGLGVFSVFPLYKIYKVGYRIIPYLSSSSLLSTKESKDWIIIAGATDGIGYQYTHLLSKTYNIIAIGRNQQKLIKLQQTIPKIITYNYDFSNESINQNNLSKDIYQKLNGQKLKGIINCVGITHFSRYKNTSLESMIKINNVNILSTHLLLKLIIKQSIPQQLSSQPFFINVSSVAGKYPNKYSAAYSASKAYISNLINVCSLQHPQITFLDLKPWYIKTKMIGYLQAWDTIKPQIIAEQSLKLLGKRKQGCGCIKHQLIDQFHPISSQQIRNRIDITISKIDRIQQLRNKRK